MRLEQYIFLFIVSLFLTSQASAQFIDNFNSNSIAYDTTGLNGWTFFTGDGFAEMDFVQSDGFASIYVDAAKDKQGIWWALIRRCVSENMNLSLLSKPNYEFRIEARIKVSQAPKRVNLHLNTQRTTDFHSHLMEFDIPDTANWHTISMTTKNFDALPGDIVNGQLALIDWGLEKYRVDIDYFKVDVVNIDSIGPDKGVQVPYHPPIPSLETFTNHVTVIQDAIIDINYPDMNFNNWYIENASGKIKLLNVSGTQIVILRWDFNNFLGKKVTGSGLLELTTYSVQRSSDYQKDFGMVRVTEIMGGDNKWNQQDVTYNAFCQGQPLNSVLNSQMIIDIKVNEQEGSTNLITISQSVLQRMLDGRTLGIAIKPLGAVNASFYAMENQNYKFTAKLHFNLSTETSDSGLNK
jgi:hypothetical protein